MHAGFLTASGQPGKNKVTVSVSHGILSQWQVTATAGSTTVMTVTSAGRARTGNAADLAAVSCASANVATNAFPTADDALWTLEPVALTGKQAAPFYGPFFRLSVLQGGCGKKKTPTLRYLGVPKSCSRNATCAPELLSGRSKGDADLIWELTSAQ